MGLIDAILNGRNGAHTLHARDLASATKRQQARGFNLILARLDSIDARLDRIEDEIVNARVACER